MNISVFGGSAPRPGEPAYVQAYELGQRLAQAGHAVLTGGYIGTMEAVSRGAAEAGGHVIGVTCDEIENWRKRKANPWVKEERHFKTLRERLGELIDGSDAAIALPGGPGTLVEISLTWNLLIVEALPPRPVILIGEGWHQVMNTFIQNQGDYIGEHDRIWLRFAPDVDGAMLELANSPYLKSNGSHS
ncbi:MAG: LOG family protein [Anaerolineaceae bacterium]